MKLCRACEAEKPTDEFYAGRAVCKECTREAARLVNLSDPEARRAIYRKSFLKKFYNITTEEFDYLAKDGCGVCGTLDDLCVDHDHSCCPGKKSCGKCVVGVLCGRHNKAEGLLHSNADEAIALAEYIKRTRL